MPLLSVKVSDATYYNLHYPSNTKKLLRKLTVTDRGRSNNRYFTVTYSKCFDLFGVCCKVTMPIHDIIDLKDQIKKLKEERQINNQERDNLIIEINKYENKYNLMKQELNTISHTNDLRLNAIDYVDIDDKSVSKRNNDNDSGNNNEYNSSTLKSFRILSDKLDMKILNEEMRNVLPALEKEVLLWESKASGA